MPGQLAAGMEQEEGAELSWGLVLAIVFAIGVFAWGTMMLLGVA